MTKEKKTPNYSPQYVKEFISCAIHGNGYIEGILGIDSEIYKSVKAAIGLQMVKFRYNKTACDYINSHVVQYELSQEGSLIEPDDMVHVYEIALFKHEPIPYPETKNVYRYYEIYKNIS